MNGASLVKPRPKVSFDSPHIAKRVASCEIVARAIGWQPGFIIAFKEEVRQATTYEEAMGIIRRHFDVIGVSAYE